MQVNASSRFNMLGINAKATYTLHVEWNIKANCAGTASGHSIPIVKKKQKAQVHKRKNNHGCVFGFSEVWQPELGRYGRRTSTFTIPPRPDPCDISSTAQFTLLSSPERGQ